jgi:ribosome-associated toxin RatA of RatAB toxin-antitoxin module
VADLSGSHSLEIDAPIERCFEIAADVERAPEWQGAMQSATALERDPAGRPALVETQIDASVAKLTLELRFTYDEPRGLRWTRESGDLKSLEGSWRFEDLGGGRTRATYALDIGLSRKLGLLVKAVKGPVEARVRELLTVRPVEGLKQRAEQDAG